VLVDEYGVAVRVLEGVHLYRGAKLLGKTAVASWAWAKRRRATCRRITSPTPVRVTPLWATTC